MRLTAAERESYARGRERFDRGDVDGALDAFTRLLETRNGFADVHYMIGVLHDRNGDSDAAAESLRRAVRLNPSYAEALLALASVYERTGDFERSRALAERASMVSRGAPGVLDATTRGKLANLQAAVGDAYGEASDWGEAIEAYRKALDRCPDFHDIRHRLGIALRQAGLPDRAVREFRRVLRGNPHFLEAQIQLGLVYYSMGRADDARAEWRAVLERDPSRDDARMYSRLLGAPN
ncbi:MAG: tetratricopeptide repeat protein [Proteobacteria bacterium]|nr:tetratricopeptide repeat protein [Pseudomonadota bacterium]